MQTLLSQYRENLVHATFGAALRIRGASLWKTPCRGEIIIGWNLANQMRADLVLEALLPTLQTHFPKGAILHSDRDSQGKTPSQFETQLHSVN